MGELNAYELLEIPYNATVKEIQAAYARLLEPYLETSPLTLSLYSKEERESMRDRLEDAYKLLITTGLRQRYDDDLIAKGSMSAEQRVAEYGEPPSEGPHGADRHPGRHRGHAPQALPQHRSGAGGDQGSSTARPCRRVREAQRDLRGRDRV